MRRFFPQRVKTGFFAGLILLVLTTLFFNCSKPNNLSPQDTQQTSGVGAHGAQITLQINSPPANTSVGQSNSAAFSVTDSLGANYAVSCSLDGVMLQNCSSPVSLNTVPAGSHTLTVTAQDQTDPSATATQTVNWTVTVASPQMSVQITTAPSNTTFTQANSVAFVVSDSQGTNYSVTCSTDGAAAQSCSSPVSLSNSAVGSHTLTVTAQDQSTPSASASQTVSWTVAAPATVPVYRLYAVNYQTGFVDNLYTLNPSESTAIAAGYVSAGAEMTALAGTGMPGTVPIYRCFGARHFVSTHADCEGARVEGTLGSLYSTNVTGSKALYRLYDALYYCYLNSTDPNAGAAQGYKLDRLLGYEP